jgi:putative toxin-antitoxin system antitoxin component (TIGR02293 family)
METKKIEKRLDIEIRSFFRSLSSDQFRTEAEKTITYRYFLEDKMLMIGAIRSGITLPIFDLIRAYTPFSERDWTDLLNISAKSLQRYKESSDYRFKPIHSEKIIEIAEVTKEGLDVFGEMDKFKLWLHTPNFALAGHKPIDLLKDSYGKELVMTELVHINHGILV